MPLRKLSRRQNGEWTECISRAFQRLEALA
ncbi:hypothetical protein V7x_36630 [Crateriforma conspicua]|uniref:Uncharacterized protein n=1 Tax=Crateriforma conspicua TaxID=2527996 RepID=A0A5C6FLH4_9PLAN|nr:hypothetical protein V7x_36630 [Crateriforma conspicua]